MVLLALDGSAPLLLGHVGTPQRMADLLREVCGQQVGKPAGRGVTGRACHLWTALHGHGRVQQQCLHLQQ
jgi:hypothetical protein